MHCHTLRFPNGALVWLSVSAWLSALVAQALVTPAVVSAQPIQATTVAQPAVPVVAPPLATATGGGLILSVDNNWVEGFGYRPVKVLVRPTAMKADDRELEVRVYSSRGYPNTPIVISQETTVIPANSVQPVSLVIPHLECVVGSTIQVGVTVNGRPAVTATANPATNANLIRTGWWGWGSRAPGCPATLLVDSQPQDMSVLMQQLPIYQQWRNYGYVNAQGQMASQMLPGAAAVPPEALPDSWLYYSAVDIMVVHIDKLKLLRTERRDSFDAICHWMRAGGSMLVTGVGANGERRPELAGILDSQVDKSRLDRPTDDGWIRPDPTKYGKPIEGQVQGSPYQPVPAQEPSPPTATPAEVAKGPPDPPPFVSRPFGMGTVVALAEDQPFPGTAVNWAWLVNHLRQGNCEWIDRHGIVLDGGNGDFWTWMIRGVGLPPVTTFRVLITVFVLAIGPVNYYWLKRVKRLHLMLVIVPLVAFLITGTLLGYAVIADGLDVRTRVLSYTEIDQRRGEATCWARSTYYAGVAPAEGLVFAEDVAVYPIWPAEWTQQSDWITRLTIWGENRQQRLANGWIGARNASQFLTVRSRASESKLLLSLSADGNSLDVENQLGSEIEWLLAVGPDGKPYVGRTIDLGDSAKLSAADAKAELDQLRRIVAERTVPGAVSTNYSYVGQQAAFVVQANMATTNTTAATSAVLSSDGMLYESIRNILALNLAQLAPGEYIAVVRRSSEYDPGVADPREVDCLHIVRGRSQ